MVIHFSRIVLVAWCDSGSDTTKTYDSTMTDERTWFLSIGKAHINRYPFKNRDSYKVNVPQESMIGKIKQRPAKTSMLHVLDVLFQAL